MPCRPQGKTAPSQIRTGGGSAGSGGGGVEMPDRQTRRSGPAGACTYKGSAKTAEGHGKAMNRQRKATERQWQAKERRWEVEERRWEVKERQWQAKERRWEVEERRWEVKEKSHASFASQSAPLLMRKIISPRHPTCFLTPQPGRVRPQCSRQLRPPRPFH